MKILAIDASASGCSVALLVDGHARWKQSLSPRTHAQVILPMVQELLGEGGDELSDLNAIAYGAGPGSFTGLRIALGFAQGLGFGLSVPLIPVCSLTALANHWLLQNLSDNIAPQFVVSVLDARMDELYWASFRLQDQQLHPSIEPQLLSVADTEHALLSQGLAMNSTYIVGPGAGLLQSSSLAQCHFDSSAEPRADAVARIGLQLFNQGKALEAAKAELNYLRNSVSWNKRNRIRKTPI